MPAPLIYLDHAATTPVHPEVLAVMQPYFAAEFGNPSSLHALGQRGEAAVEGARVETAACLGCPAQEIVFTSGGSESDNLALRGAAFASRAQRRAERVLTTPVEHPAVLRTAEALARHHGFTLELLPVDRFGRVDPEDLRRRLSPDVAVVSVIHANNEIGTINPVDELARLCAGHAIPFHTDAVQAAAHLDLRPLAGTPALISIGGHKLYGPKGVGVLRWPSGTPLRSQMTGGGQERGLRAGTHNVPLIVGLAAALRLALAQQAADWVRHTALRDRLLTRAPEAIPDSILTGHPTERLPNHASFCFRALDGNALIAALDRAGFACSSGSACKTGDPTPSEVLLALGIAPEWALGSLRVTVGRGTQPHEMDAFLDALPEAVQALRTAGAK
jgi:cysteine desulfurase